RPGRRGRQARTPAGRAAPRRAPAGRLLGPPRRAPRPAVAGAMNAPRHRGLATLPVPTPHRTRTTAMPAAAPAIGVDTQAATDRLGRPLAVPGIPGQGAAVGKEIVAALKEVGVPASAIGFDDSHTRIPEPTQTGNLIVKLPGTAKKAAKPLLFM